jgi:hypothetical protein
MLTSNRSSLRLVHLFEQDKLLNDHAKDELIDRYKLHEKWPLSKRIQLMDLGWVVREPFFMHRVPEYPRTNTTVCFNLTSRILTSNNLNQVSCQMGAQETNDNLTLSGPKRFEHNISSDIYPGRDWCIICHSLSCFPTVSTQMSSLTLMFTWNWITRMMPTRVQYHRIRSNWSKSINIFTIKEVLV